MHLFLNHGAKIRLFSTHSELSRRYAKIVEKKLVLSSEMTKINLSMTKIEISVTKINLSVT